jgi:hypothetical protein
MLSVLMTALLLLLLITVAVIDDADFGDVAAFIHANADCSPEAHVCCCCGSCLDTGGGS